jgi:hypothetical protein
LVYALANLCFETWYKPVLLAVGTLNEAIYRLKPPKTYEEMPVAIDDSDFDTILKTYHKAES